MKTQTNKMYYIVKTVFRTKFGTRNAYIRIKVLSFYMKKQGKPKEI